METVTTTMLIRMQIPHWACWLQERSQGHQDCQGSSSGQHECWHQIQWQSTTETDIPNCWPTDLLTRWCIIFLQHINIFANSNTLMWDPDFFDVRHCSGSTILKWQQWGQYLYSSGLILPYKKADVYQLHQRIAFAASNVIFAYIYVRI